MTCPNCTNPECDGLCVGGSRSVPEQKPTEETTMTTQILTQALEALESLFGGQADPDRAKRCLDAIPYWFGQQPAPHPPSRHCMCDACKPSFVDDTQPAVAQPEPVAIADGTFNHAPLPFGTPLYAAAPTQLAPQAEPCPEHHQWSCKNRLQCWEPCGSLGKDPAYARVAGPDVTAKINAAKAQPSPQPLNFDQLQKVMADHFGGRELTDDEADSAEAFARSVEAAHGITAPKEQHGKTLPD